VPLNSGSLGTLQQRLNALQEQATSTLREQVRSTVLLTEASDHDAERGRICSGLSASTSRDVPLAALVELLSYQPCSTMHAAGVNQEFPQ